MHHCPITCRNGSWSGSRQLNTDSCFNSAVVFDAPRTKSVVPPALRPFAQSRRKETTNANRYKAQFDVGAKRTESRATLVRRPRLQVADTVITSYSIHYTKLYESRRRVADKVTRFAGNFSRNALYPPRRAGKAMVARAPAPPPVRADAR